MHHLFRVRFEDIIYTCTSESEALHVVERHNMQMFLNDVCVGEDNFNNDIVYNLEQHSNSTKPTYAYYFTELRSDNSKDSLWPVPEWSKTMADHSDELPFVLGFPFLKDASPLLEGTIYLILLYYIILSL